MLAFQWSVQAKYVTDLRLSYLTACFLVSSRAFDKLPLEYQQILRQSTAKMRTRLSLQIRQQDDALIGGLFRHQGLVNVPISDALRKEFLEAASTSLDRLGDKLLPGPLTRRVREVLAEYRARHPEKSGKAAQ
jgi:TRAP-type C4-dicarboxylate transport system substrate-binding protein